MAKTFQSIPQWLRYSSSYRQHWVSQVIYWPLVISTGLGPVLVSSLAYTTKNKQTQKNMSFIAVYHKFNINPEKNTKKRSLPWHSHSLGIGLGHKCMISYWAWPRAAHCHWLGHSLSYSRPMPYSHTIGIAMPYGIAECQTLRPFSNSAPLPTRPFPNSAPRVYQLGPLGFTSPAPMTIIYSSTRVNGFRAFIIVVSLCQSC